MKIALAQSLSVKGDIEQNLQNHLKLIQSAIQTGAELVVFPELSLTNYEPELAEPLACGLDDSRFHPFQQLADAHRVVICVGMPIRTQWGIIIGMIIFQPHVARVLYMKGLLHEDELPYFVAGVAQPSVTLGGQKIAFGICYEALQREHFVTAAQGADLYIASVAKDLGGTEKAHAQFPSVAQEFSIPVLMSNCVGHCDNFWSKGKSAVWNRQGQLAAQLKEAQPGLLIYDTQSGDSVIQYINPNEVH
ncbi:MAG TPA: carbon-nitrogen hydrolase family protein [Cytophagales bacterium]|nr:carbon-nitrogen hydrolase family protein [Cytophagales bacterium]